MRLGDGQRARLTVDRCTGAVDQTEDLGGGHRLQQNAGAGDVVLVVLQRLAARFADRLQGGEMGDAIDFVLRFLVWRVVWI